MTFIYLFYIRCYFWAFTNKIISRVKSTFLNFLLYKIYFVGAWQILLLYYTIC